MQEVIKAALIIEGMDIKASKENIGKIVIGSNGIVYKCVELIKCDEKAYYWEEVICLVN